MHQKLPFGSCTEKDPAKNSIETVHAKDCKGGTPWEKPQGKNRAKERTQNGSVEKCRGATLKKRTGKTTAKERTEMCSAKKRTQKKVQRDEPMDISTAKDCTVKHAERRAEKNPPAKKPTVKPLTIKCTKKPLRKRADEMILRKSAGKKALAKKSRKKLGDKAHGKRHC